MKAVNRTIFDKLLRSHTPFTKCVMNTWIVKLAQGKILPKHSRIKLDTISLKKSICARWCSVQPWAEREEGLEQ